MWVAQNSLLDSPHFVGVQIAAKRYLVYEGSGVATPSPPPPDARSGLCSHSRSRTPAAATAAAAAAAAVAADVATDRSRVSSQFVVNSPTWELSPPVN